VNTIRPFLPLFIIGIRAFKSPLPDYVRAELEENDELQKQEISGDCCGISKTWIWFDAVVFFP
jgi:hypothetical protein